MTSVRGISIFTETGHLRWRVTPSSCRCRRPVAMATDRKVESLERIRRAVVFFGPSPAWSLRRFPGAMAHLSCLEGGEECPACPVAETSAATGACDELNSMVALMF